MITKTWQGYTISKRVKGSEFSVYVKSIYRGKITWTTDYLYAKHYTETAAKRIDREIEEDILNGTLTDVNIIADSEIITEAPQPEEDAQPKTKKFFWNDEIKAIDEAMNHMLDCIARYSYIDKNTVFGDKESQDALDYFKSEYIRLAEARAEAAKEWLAVW